MRRRQRNRCNTYYMTAFGGLLMVTVFVLAGCGGGGGGGDSGNNNPPPPTGATCVWDSSNWDGCTFDS